jgi:hypothetical protein
LPINAEREGETRFGMVPSVSSPPKLWPYNKKEEGMSRKRRAETAEQVEFVDELPHKGGPGTNWGILLQPLVQNAGQWASIKVFDTPEQAQDAQKNLMKRERLGINIPMGGGDWGFASRGCTLYAIFRGGKKRRGSRSSVR